MQGNILKDDNYIVVSKIGRGATRQVVSVLTFDNRSLLRGSRFADI